VAGICNSVGGGILFDMPPSIICRIPIAHASSQCTRQPPLLLLIIRYTTRSSRQSVARPIAATIASFCSA